MRASVKHNTKLLAVVALGAAVALVGVPMISGYLKGEENDGNKNWQATAQIPPVYSPPPQTAANNNSQVDNTTNTINERTLSVSGTATTKVKPDRVQLTFAVETREKTAKLALDSNAETMNKVLDALKQAGVQSNETGTAYFNINPNYQYSPEGNIQNLTGYTVTNSIQVTSSNLNDIPKWLDTAVNAGANRVDGINFQLSNEKMTEVRNSLIRNAISDAREKADLAAPAVGLNVVGVKSLVINEPGLYPVPYLASPQVYAGGASNTPIIVGTQDVTTTVSVVYLLR